MRIWGWKRGGQEGKFVVLLVRDVFLVYVWLDFFLFDFFILTDFSFQFPSNVLSGHADPCFYLHHDLKVKK
ncbi:hypothetical protein AV530_010924 [Patagioenas fasciata monilis]|uniref:Uncharacterized protein n=1 Tax=Patagioenas fasciata monilis TaxID=372326 RepID=A0A1V4K879_PATFA|nr:hypothetical protein AV530_010924 [Patagioenas fasciata monilis]